MNIKIIEKNDSISYESLIDVIKDSFSEWENQKLHSAVSSYNKYDLIRLSKNGKILIALDECSNKILGVLGFDLRKTKKTHYCYCSYLAVINDAKGYGIGSQLIAELIKINKSLNNEYIVLDTAVPAFRTVRFYKKNGFKIIGLESFKSTNYFSYIFRYQLNKYSVYNSDFFCRIRFFLSSFSTRIIKKKNGFTLFGKIINFFCKIVRKCFRIIKKIFFRKICTLKKENESLKYQIKYLKNHFDIHQMLPATGWLRDYQLKEVKYSVEVLSLLNAVNIHPFLEGGCLLGKLRHNGFIPYDDDIDFGIMRDDYKRLEQYCKEKFIWIDTSNFSGNILGLADSVLRQNPDRYVAIKSLFCLHIYKGKSISDTLNVEFFPFDYINEDVSEKDFLAFRDCVKNIADSTKLWKKTFDFYDKELEKSIIYSKTPTSRISFGIDNYNLTKLSFHGFLEASDIFPLQELEFEGMKLPFPNKPEAVAKIEYGDLGWPRDVGISHDIETLNDYLKSSGQKEIYYKEF